MLRIALLLIWLTASCRAFTRSWMSQPSAIVKGKPTIVVEARNHALFLSALPDDTSRNTTVPFQRKVPSNNKPLDPLLKALTRMDESTASAPSMSVPIWGELILDRSLFVLLPIAAVGLIAIIMSVVIIVHSGGEIATILQESTVTQQQPSDLSSSCRGICSNQDYDGLKAFMESKSKK